MARGIRRIVRTALGGSLLPGDPCFATFLPVGGYFDVLVSSKCRLDNCGTIDSRPLPGWCSFRKCSLKAAIRPEDCHNDDHAFRGVAHESTSAADEFCVDEKSKIRLDPF